MAAPEREADDGGGRWARRARRRRRLRRAALAAAAPLIAAGALAGWAGTGSALRWAAERAVDASAGRLSIERPEGTLSALRVRAATRLRGAALVADAGLEPFAAAPLASLRAEADGVDLSALSLIHI